MAKLTLKTVNAALKAAGHSEELVKGKNYFYFTGGESHKWEGTVVYVPYLNDLTLGLWIRELETFKNRFNNRGF